MVDRSSLKPLDPKGSRGFESLLLRQLNFPECELSKTPIGFVYTYVVRAECGAALAASPL